MRSTTNGAITMKQSNKCDWLDLSHPGAFNVCFPDIKTYNRFYKSFDEIYTEFCTMNFFQKIIWGIRADKAGFVKLRKDIEELWLLEKCYNEEYRSSK